MRETQFSAPFPKFKVIKTNTDERFYLRSLDP